MIRVHSRIIPVLLVLIVLFAGCSKESGQSADQLTDTAVEQLKAGKFVESQKSARKALEMIEDELGLRHPAAVKPLQVLAMVYQAQNQTFMAVQSYERAIDITMASSGENSIEVAQLMNNLAGLHYSSRNYEKALAVFQQSLAIAESHFPADDPRVQKIKNNMTKCEAVLAEGEPPAAPDKAQISDSQATAGMTPPDLLPEQVREAAIQKLAEQNINLYDLRPLSPVKIDEQGVVLPYRCIQKMTEKDEEGVEAVLLFALVKNQEKADAYIFQKCKMVSYDSYLEELGKNDSLSLIKTLKEVFPGVFS